MKEFKDFFKGLKRDFGFRDIRKGYKDDAGKIRFRDEDRAYGWKHRSITDQDYVEHLTGDIGIGIQPCDDQGNASFGAIDIDPKNYTNFTPQKYLKIIQDKNLPVVPIKSKSEGLHIYVFTKTPVSAEVIREFLSSLLFIFGLKAKTEIFPKQTKLGLNAEGGKQVGQFINLPYAPLEDSGVYLPDGTILKLKDALNVIENNLLTLEQLKEVAATKINEVITGGPEALADGPPCLQMICKEIMESGKKLTDGRDRFLYEYMVFAKKKYKDSWEDAVIQAGRDYIQYDKMWGDEKVKEKIKYWKKDTAGHQCHQEPISNYCAKATCLKRKFGIGVGRKNSWPLISGLIRINYKPDPEFYFNVEMSTSKTIQVHAKDVKKVTEMRELRSLIAAQTGVCPPIIKQTQFETILNSLYPPEDLAPPVGTSPVDILKKLLITYVNGPKATTHAGFESGSVLEDDGHYFFVFDKFMDDAKRFEWRKDASRTGIMIKNIFKGEFGIQKRFPKGENTKSFPPIRCLKIPTLDLAKEETPDEIIQIENKEDIV